jgi:hypothetical protein
VSGYLLLVSLDDSPVNRTNCDKIQLGWTLGETCAFLPHDVLQVFDDNPATLVCTDYYGNRIVVRFEDGARDIGGRIVLGELKVADKKFVPSTLPLAKRMKLRIERRIRAIWP